MRFLNYTLLPLVGLFACSVVNAPDDPADPAGDGGSTTTVSNGGGGNGGSGGASCVSPDVVCGNDCVDTMTDTDHCGGCNNPCVPGEFCVGAVCTADCGNLEDCGGMCADTNTDRLHCGGCNQPCDFASVCVGGSCAACTTPEVPCNNTCTDITSDVMNCGGCGVPCAMGESCSGSSCTQCGNSMLETGEEVDPPNSPFQTVSVDTTTCRWDFSQVVQLYCAGTCTWAGPSGCDQADADVLCKLKTGNPASVATSFSAQGTLALPGFTCKNQIGTDIGPLPTRGVTGQVRYQDSSVLANHGGGTVVTNVVCNPM
jgi:hypothetical protein